MLLLEERGKLVFTGSQALWFLDQLVTNQVEHLPVGRGAEALLLTPKGRITALLRILSTDTGALADMDGDVSSLPAVFQDRVFSTDAAIKEVSEEFSILRLVGPQAGDVVSKVTERADLPTEEHDIVSFATGHIVRIARPAQGFDIWSRRDLAQGIFEDLIKAGVAEMNAEEYESLRVTAGVPRYGVDFDDGYLPQEAALERTVHFNKGCYLGQESVAMAQRGSVKRRLRHLYFDASPITGEVRFEDSDVGRVTSIDGSHLGIATLKTGVEVGSAVQVIQEGNSLAAEVRELPDTNYGPQVPSARELRERLQ